MLWINSALPLSAVPVFSTTGYPKLDVNGNNTFTFKLNQTDGSKESFNNDNYGQEKAFTHTSNLYLSGELYKDLHLNATVTADPYAPDRTQWNLRYDGNDAKVLLGEFTANMGGNQYVSLNRSLRGMQVDSVLPKGSLSLITSQLKSPVRTDSFYGKNIVGPYYLQYSPIVEGSEVVMVNNVRKERQKDYTLDYTNGILTFSTGMLISRSDQVTVSYEWSGSGEASGNLLGLRASYPIADNLNVGVTHLQVNGRGTTSNEKLKEEPIEGNNTPGPFALSFRPVVEGSEHVYFGMTQYRRDVEYTIDYTAGTITFKAGYVPLAGQTLKVVYETAQSQTSPSGDHSVTGIDANWSHPSGFGLNVQAAKSQGGTNTRTLAGQKITGQPFTLRPGVLPSQQPVMRLQAPIKEGSVTITLGSQVLSPGIQYTLDTTTGVLRLKDSFSITPENSLLTATYETLGEKVTLPGDQALSATASYNKDKVSAMMRFSKVDPGFSALESVGYRNIEQALEWSGSYAPTQDLTFTTTGENVREPYNPYYAGADQNVTMQEKNRTFSLDYHKPNFPLINLSRTTRDSNQVGATGESNGLGGSTTTDNLMVSWFRDALSASFNLNRTQTDNRTLLNEATGESARYKGTTDNAALNVNYQPNERFNVGVNLARNTITSDNNGEVITGGGSSVQANATFQATKSLTLTANATSNKTDATQALDGSVGGATKSINTSVGLDWRASEKLSVGLNASSDHYEGDNQSNSQSKSLSANIWFQPSEKVNLNGYWFNQNLQYLGDNGNSKSNMVGVGAALGPFGKLKFDLDAQHIWGESSTAVNSLWQGEAQARQMVTAAVEDTTGMTQATSNRLTNLSAKVTYPIAEKHDLFLVGETTKSSGFPSESRKNTVGLGWNYHINNTTTLTFGAQRVMYADKENATNNYNTNQLNAQLSWNF